MQYLRHPFWSKCDIEKCAIDNLYYLKNSTFLAHLHI